MNGKKIITALIISLAIFLTSISAVNAVATPTFSSCLNPQGSVKASYSNGTHGIVGRTGEYKGSDAVYTLTDTTLMQCFCAENGEGIQTNWWKISNLTGEEIQTFQNLGWFFVPNGLLWGLSDAAYLAQNSTYSCKNGQGGGSGGGSTAILSAKNNSDQIISLATTGNSALIAALAFTGIVSIAFGLTLRRNS